MPRPFNVEAERTTLRLRPQTREQIRALMLDLDMDAQDVIAVAIRELWGREVGPASERDVLSELDELKAAVARLSAGSAPAEEN